MKVREGGRVVNVHASVATGVNVYGHREILGLQVTSAEDGAGWLIARCKAAQNKGRSVRLKLPRSAWIVLGYLPGKAASTA